LDGGKARHTEAPHRSSWQQSSKAAPGGGGPSTVNTGSSGNIGKTASSGIWQKKKKKKLSACLGEGSVVGPLLAARAAAALRC
jgi:hypothetical protein